MDPPRGMTADEVRLVVAWLTSERVVYQVNGGWAVDALVGRQTRLHGDLDVFLDADAMERAIAWLTRRGYETVADQRPVRIELRRGEFAVDLHPMLLDEHTNGIQQGDRAEFEHRADRRRIGTVDGVSVVVADAARLRELRRGYVLREADHHDLRQLDALARASRAPITGEGRG